MKVLLLLLLACIHGRVQMCPRSKFSWGWFSLVRDRIVMKTFHILLWGNHVDQDTHWEPGLWRRLNIARFVFMVWLKKTLEPPIRVQQLRDGGCQLDFSSLILSFVITAKSNTVTTNKEREWWQKMSGCVNETVITDSYYMMPLVFTFLKASTY